MGWGSAEVLTALVAGLAVMAAFVLVESRLPAPMLPISLFRSRSFAAGSAAIFFLWGSGLGGLFFMTQLLQNGLGNDPLTAGLRLMPWGAVTFTLPTLTGRLINRYGEGRFIAGGAALHAAAFAWVTLAARTGMPYWELVPTLILSGCGFSLAMPATQSAVLTSVALEQAGKASGALSMIRQLGGAFGLAIQVAAFAAAGSYASRHTFIAGARPALAACAGLGLLAAAAAQRCTRGDKQPSPRSPQQRASSGAGPGAPALAAKRHRAVMIGTDEAATLDRRTHRSAGRASIAARASSCRSNQSRNARRPSVRKSSC
jgi:predicted MFS family arabinose efflux permease